MENNKKYGLFTAITMLIGIVIGSGIFFKADDVLAYTNGNVLLGVLIFVIAAIAIIFGSLAFAQLAKRTDKPGGIISYAEEFVNKYMASAFGWFQVFLYISSITIVVAWVSVIYICQLFSIEVTLGQQVLIANVIILVIFFLNIISAKLGGYFQNLSMIIKLIPLVLIIFLGFIKANPAEIIRSDISNFNNDVTFNVLSAFGPIAFSFEGWVISTSICNEIKNAKRNLPIALIISPIVILACYVFYFIGISSLIGPEQVLELGDDSVNIAAQMVFGNAGAKIILIFVIISVLGTCNGLILGLIRMPYSLAIRNMLPFSQKLSKQSEKLNGMPLNSAILAICICLFWSVIHYLYCKSGMSGDISEIAICTGYINYIVLYIAIMKLTIKGKIKNKFMGYVVPIMATIGSIIVVSGGINSAGWLFVIYLFICFSVMAVGYLYYKNKDKN